MNTSRHLLCIFATILILYSNLNVSATRVTLNQGTLEGKLAKTANGFTYRSFKAIPYAKPPVGELRFRDPVPADKWTGILNATADANVCPQYDALFLNSYIGSEDCLYLNVYTPETISECDKLSVLFWIHGGAFIFGSGNDLLYGPGHLIDHDVVVVTINYRLGSVGFLSLDNAQAPGNAGLKDQALALKWVKNNIEKFGGDPNDVTLFGNSAGGASVNFMLLSSMTKGLYSKAILESGTSTNEFALQRDYIYNAFELGNLLGVQTTDKKTLINYLRNVTAESLILASFSSTLKANALHPAFLPTIEKKIPFVPAYITEDPLTAMDKLDLNDMPVIVGCNNLEGYMVLIMIGKSFVTVLQNPTMNTLVPDFTAFVPAHLKLRFDNATTQLAAQKLKTYYFPIEDNLVDRFLKFVGDYLFVKDVHSTMKLFSKQTNTYYYEFSFSGSLNLGKVSYPWPYTGASHADEMGYLFPIKFEYLTSDPIVVTDRENKTIQRMTTMWTNFAKYGNPTPNLNQVITTKWQPVCNQKTNCLSINNDLTLVDDPYAARMKIWDEIEML